MSGWCLLVQLIVVPQVAGQQLGAVAVGGSRSGDLGREGQNGDGGLEIGERREQRAVGGGAGHRGLFETEFVGNDAIFGAGRQCFGGEQAGHGAIGTNRNGDLKGTTSGRRQPLSVEISDRDTNGANAGRVSLGDLIDKAGAGSTKVGWRHPRAAVVTVECHETPASNGSALGFEQHGFGAATAELIDDGKRTEVFFLLHRIVSAESRVVAIGRQQAGEHDRQSEKPDGGQHHGPPRLLDGFRFLAGELTIMSSQPQRGDAQTDVGHEETNRRSAGL